MAGRISLFSRPETIRHALIDDHHFWRAGAILFGKIPAGNERNLYDAK